MSLLTLWYTNFCRSRDLNYYWLLNDICIYTLFLTTIKEWLLSVFVFTFFASYFRARRRKSRSPKKFIRHVSTKYESSIFPSTIAKFQLFDKSADHEIDKFGIKEPQNSSNSQSCISRRFSFSRAFSSMAGIFLTRSSFARFFWT